MSFKLCPLYLPQYDRESQVSGQHWSGALVGLLRHQGRTPLQIGPDVRLRQVHGRYRDSSLQYPGHEEDMLRAK